MSVRVRCRKCGSPIRSNRVVDGMGNRLNTLNCWNGHYEKIDVEFLDWDDTRIDLTIAEVRKILPRIEFIQFNKK